MRIQLQKKMRGPFGASAVVTFAAPKLAHVLGHLTAPDVMGPVVVAGIRHATGCGRFRWSPAMVWEVRSR